MRSNSGIGRFDGVGSLIPRQIKLKTRLVLVI